MSLAQKLHAMQAAIDGLERRVKELERLGPRIDFANEIVSSVLTNGPSLAELVQKLGGFPEVSGRVANGPGQLMNAIDTAQPIAFSDTMPAPRKKRGRPPKA